MKRLFLLPALSAVVLLLSACPDTKLPTPAPKVPEPRAAALAPLAPLVPLVPDSHTTATPGAPNSLAIWARPSSLS